MVRIAAWRRRTFWRWQDNRQARRSGGVIPGVITAQKGTFTITGFDAGLVASHLPLTAADGSFAITGVDATLTYSGSGSTNYTATYLSQGIY